MALNCQPNQLARIISAPESIRLGVVDKIVHTVKLVVLEGSPGWTLAESIPLQVKCPCGCGRFGKLEWAPDAMLRPIKDPPADAVDEMVKLAGKAPVLHGDWEAA